jgi:hypothetical protein
MSKCRNRGDGVGSLDFLESIGLARGRTRKAKGDDMKTRRTVGVVLAALTMGLVGLTGIPNTHNAMGHISNQHRESDEVWCAYDGKA